MGIRLPVAAGDAYPEGPAALRTAVRRALTHERGPGESTAGSSERAASRSTESVTAVGDRERGGDPTAGGLTGPSGPATRDADGPVAVVVPHGPYRTAGPVAAHGLAALARRGTPDAVVVVGPNHHGIGDEVAVAGNDRWRTPLGDVAVDDRLRDRLVETGPATVDASAHAREQAVETLLPMLQYALDGEFDLLPVAVRRYDRTTADALGRALARVVDGRRVPLVASTTLTRREPHEVAVRRDEPLLDRLLDVDPGGLVRTVDGDVSRMCGPISTAAVLSAVRRLGVDGSGAELYAHASSGETAGSKAYVDSYAAIGFHRSTSPGPGTD